MFPRPVRLLLLLALLGAVVAGCGGGGGSSAASGSTASSTGATTQAAPAAAGKTTEPSPLDPLAEILEEDGFQGTQPVPGGGNHIAAAMSAQPAQGGNIINIYYYDDPEFGRQEDARIEGFFAAHPGHGLVHSHGHYLASTVSESELTAVEKKNFKIVVKGAATAEAGE